MDIEVLILLIGFFAVFGSVLFFFARLFIKKEIKSSPKVEKSHYLTALGVIAYLALIFIFSFNDQELIAKIMLISAFIFGIVGAFFIERDHD